MKVEIVHRSTHHNRGTRVYVDGVEISHISNIQVSMCQKDGRNGITLTFHPETIIFRPAEKPTDS